MMGFNGFKAWCHLGEWCFTYVVLGRAFRNCDVSQLKRQSISKCFVYPSFYRYKKKSFYCTYTFFVGGLVNMSISFIFFCASYTLDTLIMVAFSSFSNSSNGGSPPVSRRLFSLEINLLWVVLTHSQLKGIQWRKLLLFPQYHSYSHLCYARGK